MKSLRCTAILLVLITNFFEYAAFFTPHMFETVIKGLDVGLFIKCYEGDCRPVALFNTQNVFNKTIVILAILTLACAGVILFAAAFELFICVSKKISRKIDKLLLFNEILLLLLFGLWTTLYLTVKITGEIGDYTYNISITTYKHGYSFWFMCIALCTNYIAYLARQRINEQKKTENVDVKNVKVDFV